MSTDTVTGDGSPQPVPPKYGPSKTGIIAASSLAGVVLLILVVILGAYFWRRKQDPEEAPSTTVRRMLGLETVDPGMNLAHTSSDFDRLFIRRKWAAREHTEHQQRPYNVYVAFTRSSTRTGLTNLSASGLRTIIFPPSNTNKPCYIPNGRTYGSNCSFK